MPQKAAVAYGRSINRKGLLMSSATTTASLAACIADWYAAPKSAIALQASTMNSVMAPPSHGSQHADCGVGL